MNQSSLKTKSAGKSVAQALPETARHFKCPENSKESIAEAILFSTQLLSVGKCVAILPGPTGYVLAATCAESISWIYGHKERPISKTVGVDCYSSEHFSMLAVTDEKIIAFAKKCEEKKLRVNCILPWNEPTKKLYLRNINFSRFLLNSNGTGCFKLNMGFPRERIAGLLWSPDEPRHRKLLVTTSANISSDGNTQSLKKLPATILNAADVVINADHYVVTARKPHHPEQSVVVSFVGDDGLLSSKGPAIIRKGFNLDLIYTELKLVYETVRYSIGDFHN